MTTKLNKYSFAMRQKYGAEWDTPLFARHREPAPPPVPNYINDATEEKAEVYGKIIETPSLEEQRNKVLQVIREFKNATDNQIARALKINPSTVAARRNELRDMGKVIPVLDHEGRKVKLRDSITGIPNTLWTAVI